MRHIKNIILLILLFLFLVLIHLRKESEREIFTEVYRLYEVEHPEEEKVEPMLSAGFTFVSAPAGSWDITMTGYIIEPVIISSPVVRNKD